MTGMACCCHADKQGLQRLPCVFAANLLLCHYLLQVQSTAQILPCLVLRTHRQRLLVNVPTDSAEIHQGWRFDPADLDGVSSNSYYTKQGNADSQCQLHSAAVVPLVMEAS